MQHPRTVLRTAAGDLLVADPCFGDSQVQHRCRKFFSSTLLNRISWSILVMSRQVW
jgi:hypothetical protein